MPTQSAIDGTAQAARPLFPTPVPAPDLPALLHEHVWRQPVGQPGDPAGDRPVFASRWTDGRTTARHERSAGAADRYVIGVALRPVRARVGRRDSPAFDGVLSAGTVHVTAPGRLAEAEFFSPCDFVHFHVAAGYLRDRQVAASSLPGVHREDAASAPGLHDLVVRDELAAHLSRTLTRMPGSTDPLYPESVGQTILMRLLANGQAAPRVGALPKWRMRRVQEHVATHLADPIRLADLAQAAGLSRMHFAAQFRAATGCRPHDFVLQHRIEAAKAMLTDTDLPLVEVALSTGFQTQSHFSGVFKRLVGETPARWQHAHRHG